MLFAGVLNPTYQDPNDAVHHVQLTPLMQTTDRGNAWKNDQIEMMLQYDPGGIDKAVYRRHKAGGDGISFERAVQIEFPQWHRCAGRCQQADDSKAPMRTTPKETGDKTYHRFERGLGGLCTVVVFSDVDFISDIIAYQKTFFGSSVVGDNAAMLMNTIEDLTGSTDLIAMRSRGSFQRPFVVVDKIEQEAEKQTAQEEEKINARSPDSSRNCKR